MHWTSVKGLMKLVLHIAIEQKGKICLEKRGLKIYKNYAVMVPACVAKFDFRGPFTVSIPGLNQLKRVQTSPFVFVTF